MRRTVRRTSIAALTALTALAATATTAGAYRRPSASYTVGDPGVLYANGQWNVLATGSWSNPGEVSTSSVSAGPFEQAPNQLLTRRPAWAAKDDHSVWAPSETYVNGQYVVFYAALVARAQPRRCIGTGVSSSPTGPFEPRDTPIACVSGHGAPDSEPAVADDYSTIDATPAWVKLADGDHLFLTYKTQRLEKNPTGGYYTAIRMVELDPATQASTVLGTSSQLTARSHDIEENPVLVQRGNRFTLFTSLGGYTLCGYHTEWRQSKDIWNWPQHGHRLKFPAGTNTCGTGDAQVVPGLEPTSTRIFFSGHYPHRPPRKPATCQPKERECSFKLYVGAVEWPDNKPVVTKLLPAGTQ